MAVSSTEQSEATRIQKLEKFLNRELRGSTLTNYTLKADIRAHRKAEKINKVDILSSKMFDKKILNEYKLARLHIETDQMRYARKLHTFKIAQMKAMQETSSRVNTAPGLPNTRRGGGAMGGGGDGTARTWTSGSKKINNADLRNIIRSSTNVSSAKLRVPHDEEDGENRAKTAAAAFANRSTARHLLNSQDMFIAKLSTLLKPAEQEVKSKRVKEEPVEVVVELTPQQKRNRSIVRLPTIALDGGTAAREFQKYPDAPEEFVMRRDNLLKESDKEDTMYAWLGFDSQEQMNKRRGLDKFKLMAKRVTIRATPRTMEQIGE